MNVFRTFILPENLANKAAEICDALGYPEKGMFTATIKPGKAPSKMDDPDLRPTIGVISSGYVDDSCPLLGTAQELFDACKARAELRKEVSTITLGDCTAVINVLSKGEFEPLPEISKVKINGRVDKWVKPDPIRRTL